MTPKEKAEELVDKFYQTTPNEYFVNEPIGIKGRYKSWEQAKHCALIAVDEIIEATNMYQYGISNALEHIPAKIVKHPYWQEVKQEIENL